MFNDNIKKLALFLKRSKFLQEYNYLLKISNQINEALDPKPFQIRLPQEINILEGMSSDATEYCHLVNFGIERLQSPSVIKNMKEKTPFFPEEINLVHFDLMKLIKCIDINEKSYIDLRELLYSLSNSKITTQRNNTKESFLDNFENFPYIKQAFEAIIDNEKLNYILIGTSDTAKNFLGSEAGAQRFHQNTLNYVLHDLGHATYDLGGNFKRKVFKPFEIIYNYRLKGLKEFDKYLEKDKKINFERLKNYGGAEESSIGSLVGFLRRQGIFFDLRYLVGTHQGRAKMFTDKSDYDQDIFAYILMSPTNQVSDIFKDPMIPPRMNKVFDNRPNGEQDRSSFVSFINSEHKKMIDEVQRDLEEKIRDYGGYINFISEKKSEYRKETDYQEEGEVDLKPNKENILIFNMLAESLFYIDRILAERLRDKGYSNVGFGLYVGDNSSKTALWADNILTEKVLDRDLKEGNLAIINLYDEDSYEENYKEILKRFNSFGKYRLLLENREEYFYVSDSALKVLSLMRKDLYYDILDLTEEDLQILSVVPNKDKYTKKIVMKKLEYSLGVFFEDADLSRLKNVIYPLNPGKDLNYYR